MTNGGPSFADLGQFFCNNDTGKGNIAWRA